MFSAIIFLREGVCHVINQVIHFEFIILHVIKSSYLPNLSWFCSHSHLVCKLIATRDERHNKIENFRCLSQVLIRITLIYCNLLKQCFPTGYTAYPSVYENKFGAYSWTEVYEGYTSSITQGRSQGDKRDNCPPEIFSVTTCLQTKILML